jgi:hypothetical protein
MRAAPGARPTSASRPTPIPPPVRWWGVRTVESGRWPQLVQRATPGASSSSSCQRSMCPRYSALEGHGGARPGPNKFGFLPISQMPTATAAAYAGIAELPGGHRFLARRVLADSVRSERRSGVVPQCGRLGRYRCIGATGQCSQSAVSASRGRPELFSGPRRGWRPVRSGEST